MALICSKCESHYLIEDYDQRLHYITGYHCGMCGSTKLIEQNNASCTTVLRSLLTTNEAPSTQNEAQKTQPEVNMPHPKCEIKECTSIVVKSHLCMKHYREKYGKSPKGKCSFAGCQTQIVKEGLCHKHLTVKYGYSPYPKGKDDAQKIYKKPLPSTFVEVAPSVLVPKETKELVDQVNALRSPGLSTISRKETITMKVRGEEGGILEGRIAFTYRNGSPPEFNWAGIKGTQDPLTYDDWMFLGAIANEIKRIAGA